MARVGVFICFCGANIADYVDVPQVVEEVKRIKEVKYPININTCALIRGRV